MSPARLIVLASLFVSGLASHSCAEAQTVREYMEYASYRELRIAPDGKSVVYVALHPTGEFGERRQVVVWRSLLDKAEKREPDELQEARSLRWTSDSKKLFFLRPVDGVSQIFSYNVKTGSLIQHTHHGAGVLGFSISAAGNRMAWIASDKGDPATTLALKLETETKGVLIPSEQASLFDFVNPQMPDGTVIPRTELWWRDERGHNTRVNLSGSATRVRVSPNGRYLSIQFVSNDLPKIVGAAQYSSVGLYSLDRRTFLSCLPSEVDEHGRLGTYYTLHGWDEDSRRFIVKRLTERVRWWRYDSHWITVSAGCEILAAEDTREWKLQSIRGGEYEFVGEHIIALNQTVAAKRSVYQIKPNDISELPGLATLPGDVSLFSANATFDTGVFVYSEIGLLPEIFLWKDAVHVARLSTYNRRRQHERSYTVESASWKSDDETLVQGWLLLPEAADEARPVPLVVFLHGGPAIVVKNQYADYHRLWPFPLELIVDRGMAVFIPNYRGTASFGKSFVEPSELDGEPVDDVVSGIRKISVIPSIDGTRIGLLGHSHGAWLAAIVMTRMRNIETASLAEFVLNQIVAYELSARYLNVDVHGVLFGGAPSDRLKRYAELSPDFEFPGLGTAVLFEGSGKALAVGMIGNHKAAVAANMPTEFVVYPQANHNLRLSTVVQESAERNLDWLRFWLQGFEDSAPDKRDQYIRWRRARRHTCSLTPVRTPLYCEFIRQRSAN